MPIIYLDDEYNTARGVESIYNRYCKLLDSGDTEITINIGNRSIDFLIICLQFLTKKFTDDQVSQYTRFTGLSISQKMRLKAWWGASRNTFSPLKIE